MPDATSFDVEAFARRERRREEQEAREARAWASRAQLEARRLAREIADRCGGVERVVLFGSLARGEAGRSSADIDLAVWGTPEGVLRAVSIGLGSPFPVDVIDARDAPPHLLHSILRDGVVLHAR